MPFPPPDYLAHLDAKSGRPHLLEDQLRAVGKKAAEFAERFGSADWGQTAGIWHDLGKYRQAFQDMIRAANGEEAHTKDDGGGGRIDHSSPGGRLGWNPRSAT